MLKKVQVAWHEVSCVRLRGNLQSGAVTRGGASAPTLHHEAIMMLGEWLYLFCIILCDIMKMRVQSVGQICVN